MMTFLIGSASLYAQIDSIPFSRLTEADGLSSNEVHCLLQDHRGFIWIGTRDGLNRYDGIAFTTYYADPDDPATLSNNFILTLYEDQQHNLWIGTDGGGLNRFNPVTETFTRYLPDKNNPNTISGNRVAGLYEDRQGNLWVGAENGGINLMDREKGTFAHWKPYPYPDTLLTRAQWWSNLITRFAEDPANDNILWLGSGNGFYSFNTVTKRFRDVYPGDKNTTRYSITSIYRHTPDSFWITTWGNGLLLYDKKKDDWKTFRYDHSSTLRNINTIMDIAPKSGHELWIAALDRGLGIFDINTQRFSFFEPPVKESYAVYIGAWDILKDNSGIVWVGTSNGVLKIDPRMQLFRHYQLSTRLQEYLAGVRATIAVQAPGEELLYIGSLSGDGLYAMNRKTNAISSIPYLNHRGQMQQVSIIDMLYSKTGTLWIAGTNGLYFLNKAAGRVELFQQSASDTLNLKGKPIYDIMESPDGNIWLVIDGLGLIKMDGITHQMTFYGDFTDICILTQSNTIDNKGNIWLAASDGPIKIDAASGKATHYSNVPVQERGSNFWCVSGIEQDNEGMIWAALRGAGLIRIDPDLPPDQKFKKLKMEDGLLSLNSSGMMKDKNGQLWINTNKGLSRLDPVTLNITNFTYREGLRVGNINNNIASLSTGEIFVGGYKGFTLFHPDSLGNNPHRPPVVFRSFSVFGEEMAFDKDLNYMDHIELSYRQNFFTFSFAGLNYSFPEKTQYTYKLEGFDSNWIDNGTQRQANYTNVDPGRYTFRVKAANSNGVWNEEGISIGITITPPFWKTWWFYSLCVLTVLALIYLIFRYRIGQVKKREKLKAEFEKKLATIQMTALNAQMNPHFLFNCLNSIKLYVIKNDIVAASDYLSRFSRLIRLVLENSKSQKVILSNELKALKLYIELETLRFEHHFVYELNIDEDMDTESIEIPPLILQPYIENAIWHGLMHKEEKGKLEITLGQKNDFLHCIIEDNGIGRKKSRELKSKSVTRHKSMGMSITEDRITMTNKLYNMNASVTVTDLENKKGEASGTRVSLQIPV